jgi:hypothetical protein
VVGRRTLHFAAALAVGAVTFAGFAPASPAATREPLAAAASSGRTHGSAIRPAASALRAMVRETARRYASAAGAFRIASDSYGDAELESVAAVLRSLDHGPELAELSVFVATPEEIREACGSAVVACYFPSVDEMVVSGVDRAVDGVPRDFAIAHEYGHHIANTRPGAALPAIEAGTPRWATYERVCQLARRGRLFPGNQAAHYWQDPEEAFAQSYARLNRPGARVSWQYTPLLRPTAVSLAKIHADVAHPWRGPVETSWAAAVAAPPGESAPEAGSRSGAVGIGSGRPVGDPAWVATHTVRTPLDGPVSVSLQTTAGVSLSAALRDPRAGRVVARAVTGPDGSARIAYSNCGHAALSLEVRAISGPASFQAAIARP